MADRALSAGDPAFTAQLKDITAELRRALVSEPIGLDDGGTVYLAGSEIKTIKIEPLNPVLPDRVAAAETVVEPHSFIEYINRFKTPTAIARASLTRNTITAVLDYHAPTDHQQGVYPEPQPLRHTVTLTCPYDVDYLSWKEKFQSEEGMDQRDLAAFVEDMIHTITAPAAADLLEAITDLHVDRQVKLKSGIRQSNGTVLLNYEEEDNATPKGGSATLPQFLMVSVPVFQGTPPVELKVRLRYRLDRGNIGFTLSVPGLDKLERELAAGTAIPVYYVA